MACQDSSGPGIILDVAPDSLQLLRNGSAQLSVNALDGEGHLVTGIAVAFESGDSTIATVTNLGLVQAKTSVGETTVRVTGGGAVTEVPVRVIPTPSSVVLNPGDTTIASNMTVPYRAVVLDEIGDTIPEIALTWVVSDTTIATITSSGLARAKSKVGDTFISAGVAGYFASAILRVRVPGVPARVVITPSDTSISSTTSAQLTATVRDAFGNLVTSGSISWSSNNTAVATVSSSGLVHSEGPTGTATISATADAVSGTTTVTVLDSLLLTRTRVRDRAHAAAISSGNVAYVTQLDLNLVSRIDLSTHKATDSIAVGSIPTGVTFNAAGTRAYVTNQYSSTVSVINVSTNTVIDQIAIGTRPFEVLVAPGDSILYVTKIDSVYGVRLSTKAIIARFPIPDAGNGIAIARDTLLYVSTNSGGTVVEFNLRTHAVGRTFVNGGTTQKLVVSADGNELYVPNLSGEIQFWDLDSGLKVGTVALPGGGYGLARRPSNGLLYGTSAYYGGYLYVIDPATRTLLHAAVIGGDTRHVVFTADGSVGIIPNEGGWVDFIR